MNREEIANKLTAIAHGLYSAEEAGLLLEAAKALRASAAPDSCKNWAGECQVHCGQDCCRSAAPVRPSDRDLWEAGCLTRAQTETWTDNDLAKHSAGIRKTLKHLFNIIDAALAPATEDGGIRAALEPFASFGFDENGNNIRDGLMRDRICDWFGPADFDKASRALSPSPSVGTGTQDHLRQIKAFASVINERNFLDIALHIGRQADEALEISSAQSNSGAE